MRLDVFLTERGYYKSRARSARAVSEGCVKVNGSVVTKSSYDVDNGDLIEAAEDPVAYVSRGGLKLEGALNRFGIDVSGRTCVDIGASTGGFTQVLLERGASHVDCVDVGTNQLAPELRSDPRVSSFENTDAREFAPGRVYDFLCMDVSFISVKSLSDTVLRLLAPDGTAVILVKPQFEAGRQALNKKGIVKDIKLAEKALADVISHYISAGFEIRGSIVSPVKGGDGNVEYLIEAVRIV